jgi:hydrogenase maturation protein HypF
MTSGNISEEPIIIDDLSAGKKLSSVADSVVSYNRDIYNRVDDSVVRIINNRVSLIRRSRGFVPRPVDLRLDVEGALAMGAEEKNSFCIGKDRQAVMSQFIGDLQNQSACDFYLESINRFSDLFRFTPLYIACDMHPDYYSTVHGSDLGKKLKIPVIKVQHHHAILSCMAEHGLEEKVIGISLDGTDMAPTAISGRSFNPDLEKVSKGFPFDYIRCPVAIKYQRSHGEWLSYLYKYFGETIDYNMYQYLPGANAISLLRR